MDRRTLAGGLLATPLAAEAQQPVNRVSDLRLPGFQASQRLRMVGASLLPVGGRDLRALVWQRSAPSNRFEGPRRGRPLQATPSGSSFYSSVGRNPFARRERLSRAFADRRARREKA
jgi:hypothetical protein